MHHLKNDNGTLITDGVDLANTLGAAIEKSSSSNNNKSSKVSRRQMKSKRSTLNKQNSSLQ